MIQDTTQPNFERNRENITDKTGLGVIGDGASLGFFLHPSLVIDADTGRTLGYSHIHHWSRPEQAPVGKQKKTGKWAYQEKPIEEKESYRWIESAQKSKAMLEQAGKITVVCDREGDIWEFLSTIPDERTELLVRCNHNRTLQSDSTCAGQTVKLFDRLTQSSPVGTCLLDVKGDERKKRKKRQASMIIRCSQVTINSTKQDGKTVQLYAVEAREDPQSVPPREKPIHWRLLTTHVVEDLAQALTILKWYAMRWNIEQVFRLIKQKGMNVEASDIESGPALIKLTLTALFAVVKIMLLHLSSKEQKPQPLGKTFSEKEMDCLKDVCAQYEGKTVKQQNPYSPDSLQWCYWTLARLGGWKPHEKQAGVITLSRGWQDFQKIFYGWSLAQNFVS